MLSLKKFIIGVFLFFAIVSPAFAVPGELIYDVNTPPQPTVDSSCNENLAICKKESENTRTLYQTCQVQKSQLGKTNMILVITLIAVILFSAIGAVAVLVFLKKKPSNLP